MMGVAGEDGGRVPLPFERRLRADR
jgi:hypothetical protein